MPQSSSLPVRHCYRLAEMGDRLLEGRAAQRLFAGFAPPFDCEIVEAGFVEMMAMISGPVAVRSDLPRRTRRRGDAAPGDGS